MGCSNGKLCQWIQGISQLAVATVIVFAGYTINTHMESWTKAFNQGSSDLHHVSLAMQEIQGDMKVIRSQMDGMNTATRELSGDFKRLNIQMDQMNNRVGQVQRRMSPMGMMRGMMPW